MTEVRQCQNPDVKGSGLRFRRLRCGTPTYSVGAEASEL